MPWGVWEESTWESCTWNGNVQKIGRDQIRANSITPRRIDKDATRPYIQQQLDMFNANVILGDGALASRTTGIGLVAAGTDALAGVTTSNYHVGVGHEAGKATNAGTAIVAVGYRAARLSTGSGQTAIGTNAAQALVNGTENAFVGVAAGYGLVTANYVTAVGAGALYGILTTSITRSVAIGYFALGFGGDYCVAVGAEALQTATGDYNTAVGNGAGANISSGEYNIIVGAGVNAQNGSSSYQINIGNAFQRDASGNLKLRRGTTSFSDALVLEDDAVLTADTFKIDGGIRKKFTIQTGTYTIPDTVAVVICNSGSDFTVTLPAATGSGQEITVKNRNTNTVTIEGDGSDSIDGAANTTLTSNQRVTVLDYAAGQWAVVG